MATYLPGITDYIPQIQPFKPDLNFYSKVLQMKQDKYDAAKREISSLYGSLLYSPLTRQSNINRRDTFFKNIEHHIKKISAMDLSLAENQEAAMKIFDPIINDNEMSHDWAYTKNIMTQMERGESFRMCADPKKCGGSYSPESITYLNLKLQEYSEADSTKALSMSTSDAKFVPYNNIVKDALDWAKSMGFLVEETYKNGGYIVKRQAGQTIKVPLMQLFLSTFGKDPKYRMHYDQLAYINKRNWIQENLADNENDPIKTESAYYNEIITKTIKNLEADANEYDDIHNGIKTRSNAYKNRLSSEGMVANDHNSIEEIMDSFDDEEISNEADGYYKDLKNRIANLSVNREDMTAFGKGVESIVGDALMKMDLMEGVENFANTFSVVTDIKEDQFSLNAQRHQYAVDEMIKKFELDDQAAINAKIYEIGKEAALKFMEGGLPSDQEGIPIPGTATPQGSVDMYKTTEEGYSRNRQGVFSNYRDFNSRIITTLQNIVSNSQLDAETRKQAKDELTNMLGPFYDPKSNMFVDLNNNNTKLASYSQLTLDMKNEETLYQNGKKILARNSGDLGILRTQVNDGMRLIEQTEQMNMMRNGYGKILTDNNALIKKVFKAHVEKGQQILFEGLFEESTDGSINVITSEDQYVKKMWNTKFNEKMTAEKKEKVLRKAFKKNYELYKEMYNSPGEYGIVGLTPPTGYSITEGPDGAVYAEGRSYISNYMSPNSPGNIGFIDFMKDVKKNEAYTRALMGSRHTADEYEDEDESKTARFIFEQYRSGLLSGAYTTEDSKKKAPRADVEYYDVAAGTPGMTAVSLKNINPEWLKTLATNKEKTMIGSTSIDDINEKGVTIYMSADVANNLFRNNHKQKPGDVYLNSGLTWNASRPQGGNASITKVGNNIVINGYLIGIDSQGRQRNIPLTSTIPSEDEYGPLSGAKLINEYTRLLEEQHDANVNFKLNGGLPRIYDEESLKMEIAQRLSGRGGASQGFTTIQRFRNLIGR